MATEQFDQCGLSEQARTLAALIITDPEQQRNRQVCSSALARIAADKAREMAARGIVNHIGESHANKRLINAGYPLSRIYPRLFENNVEAIAGGISTAQSMWQEFKDSIAHRNHLLAEHEFYRLQDEIGVGFFYHENSPHGEYWVVYLAHQRESGPYNGKIARSKD